MKPRLLIVSERTRWHFHSPLRYFQKIEVIHLTKSVFSDFPKKNTSAPLYFYRSPLDLYQQILRFSPDIIQGLEPYYGYSRLKIPWRVVAILRTIQKAAARLNVPYFFHCLENLAPEKKYNALSFLMRCLARNYTRKAAFVFSLNKEAGEIVKEDGAKKVIPALWGIWGVDKNIFKPAKKGSKPSLLFVGALSRHKGADILVELSQQLRQEISDLELWMVGRGILENKLKKAVSQNPWLKYLGEQPPLKVAKLMGRAWVGIAPNREIGIYKEQVGMVNLEMLASATPLVTTDAGSTIEFLENKAIICPQNDFYCLKENCLKLLKNEKLRLKMSKEAFLFVRQKYDIQTNIQNLEGRVLEILAGLGLKVGKQENVSQQRRTLRGNKHYLG